MATSAFQIEGARRADGKGESIWDRFADDGRLADSADHACDHYHRWEEDLDLLADLGVGAYRFSVAWTRVLPNGVGDVDERGIRFYERLIDGLERRGIEPWLTLYHWDLPQSLQEAGGWARRENVDAFASYADLLARRFGDRVGHWITINEPWVAAYLGHLYGEFAPGISDWGIALQAGHHLLLAHAAAMGRIKALIPNARLGPAIDCRPATPASESPADVDAARHFDGFRNRWFFDPVFGLGYPEDMVAAFHAAGRIDAKTPSFVLPGDMEAIGAPIDFLGLNYYTTSRITAGEEERDDPEGGVGAPVRQGFTEMGWRIDPEGMTSYLHHLHDRYQPQSIVVTENGASFGDSPGPDGTIEDTRRVDYLDRHIAAIAAARSLGVPVDGYFVWSLLDNLEWTQGFSQRFGLVWVDHHTQARIPKASFHWYRQVADPNSAWSRRLST